MDRRLPPALVFENTRAVVKWFNARKGYGFVRIDASEGRDALLHISVLSRAGRETLGENATLICDVAEDRRGLQIVAIHSIDDSSAIPAASGRGEASETTEGIVKFFSPVKGFGFISPDNGGPDVFVSGHILDKCGVSGLQQDQRVRIVARQGVKGPQAVRIEVIG